jgi:hypothetical protein
VATFRPLSFQLFLTLAKIPHLVFTLGGAKSQIENQKPERINNRGKRFRLAIGRLLMRDPGDWWFLGYNPNVGFLKSHYNRVSNSDCPTLRLLPLSARDFHAIFIARET